MRSLTAMPASALGPDRVVPGVGLWSALAAGIRDMVENFSGKGAPRDRELARLDALAQRALRGDRPSLERLLREIAPHVLRLAHHLVGNADAHDAAQESLTRVATSIARFDSSRGGFRPWALMVTRNHCLDRLRRRGLQRRTFVADATPATRASSPTADPERSSIARGELSRVQHALDELPEGMASALMLFHVQEMSYEEIAQTLDTPVGTVMSWLHRGRKRLRAAVQQEEA